MVWERQSPWRQGKFLSVDDLKALASDSPEFYEGKSGAIIASQDCDIAQDPAVEPSVEFVPFTLVEKSDGNRLNAKNPRFLQLPLVEPAGKYLEVDTRLRAHFKKEDLVALSPNDGWEISPMSVYIFQKWLALRYKRSAFPDAFNNRLGSAGRKNITKPIESTAESIEAVLFDLDDCSRVELEDDGEPYPLTITLVYNDEVVADAEELACKAAEKIQENLTARFWDEKSKEWNGIELHEVHVVSMRVISLYEAETLLRFDLDELSFKKDFPSSTLEVFEAKVH